MQQHPEYIYSRCKLGKQRVFYVVWRWEDFFDFEHGQRPITSGYAGTVEEAEALMAAAAPAPEALIDRRAYYAASYHSTLACEKRKQRPPAEDQDCDPVEYVYEDWWDNEDCVHRATPYRIIKRTRKRVFIRVHRGGFGVHDERTHALDRAQLEQTGKASTGRGWGRRTYYVSIEVWEQEYANLYRRQDSTPDCLAYFGLKLPTNLDSLKAVYRDRVKQTHPDHGGSANEFRVLQAQYRAALQLLECRS